MKSYYKDRMIWVDGTASQSDVSFVITESIRSAIENGRNDKSIASVPKFSDSMKSLKIIFASAPASGKDKQCEVIKEHFGVVHKRDRQSTMDLYNHINLIKTTHRMTRPGKSTCTE